jgi:predicted dehydrogenase
LFPEFTLSSILQLWNTTLEFDQSSGRRSFSRNLRDRLCSSGSHERFRTLIPYFVIQNAFQVTHMLVSGILSGGAPVSIHYRGGMARDGDGFFWEINGTAGDIRVSGPFGHTQFVPLSLKGARGDEKTFQPLEVPASYRTGWPEDMAPGNVARIYGRMAHDLREGTRTAPSFEDAVGVHRVIASIERAAEHVSRT